jgi:hypothetical protein
MKTAAHQGTHTKAYYNRVNQAIQDADKAGGKQGVIDTLCQICNNLGGR